MPFRGSPVGWRAAPRWRAIALERIIMFDEAVCRRDPITMGVPGEADFKIEQRAGRDLRGGLA